MPIEVDWLILKNEFFFFVATAAAKSSGKK